MSEDASYRDSHAMQGKGEQYDSYYENDPWQAFMWRHEQACIDDLRPNFLFQPERRRIEAFRRAEQRVSPQPRHLGVQLFAKVSGQALASMLGCRVEVVKIGLVGLQGEHIASI